MSLRACHWLDILVERGSNSTNHLNVLRHQLHSYCTPIGHSHPRGLRPSGLRPELVVILVHALRILPTGFCLSLDTLDQH